MKLCYNCRAEFDSGKLYCDDCLQNLDSLDVTLHFTKDPNHIKGKVDMLNLEGERKFKRRLDKRNKILASAKQQGRKNLKPSQLRELGA